MDHHRRLMHLKQKFADSSPTTRHKKMVAELPIVQKADAKAVMFKLHYSKVSKINYS